MVDWPAPWCHFGTSTHWPVLELVDLSRMLNVNCDTCGAVENDFHLFFHCNLPRAVWASFSPPMTTDNLPHEPDGIQLTLQSFLSNSTSDTTFNKMLYTLWYIWKARNDYHFNRKQCTSTQVHHAAAAHMSSYNAALNSPGDGSSQLHRGPCPDHGP